MKILIICFSQTGNTKSIAEHIKSGIDDVADHCEIIAMEDVKVDTLADYDLVGLGCPVYYYQEPINVQDFITGLPELNNKRWFVFCTHGSIMGVTLISMTNRLEKKGIDVIGSHHTYADASMPFYPYPTTTTGHPDEIELKNAEIFGRQIVACSQAVAQGDRSGVTRPAPATEQWTEQESINMNKELFELIFPRLSIDLESCTECGDCQEACPVKGIDIGVEPRKIQDPCIYCFHCINVCPTGSIESNWEFWEQIVPDQYAKYVEALNNAEARGDFRWKMDPNTLDFANPLYKQARRKIGKA